MRGNNQIFCCDLEIFVSSTFRLECTRLILRLIESDVIIFLLIFLLFYTLKFIIDTLLDFSSNWNKPILGSLQLYVQVRINSIIYWLYISVAWPFQSRRYLILFERCGLRHVWLMTIALWRSEYTTYNFNST